MGTWSDASLEGAHQGAISCAQSSGPGPLPACCSALTPPAAPWCPLQVCGQARVGGVQAQHAPAAATATPQGQGAGSAASSATRGAVGSAEGGRGSRRVVQEGGIGSACISVGCKLQWAACRTVRHLAADVVLLASSVSSKRPEWSRRCH